MTDIHQFVKNFFHKCNYVGNYVVITSMIKLLKMFSYRSMQFIFHLERSVMIGLGATSDLFVFYRGKSREEANIKKC